MPLLKMYFQTKDARSVGNLLVNQQQNLVIAPSVSVKPLGSARPRPLLSGMVERIRSLPKGCKSCGR